MRGDRLLHYLSRLSLSLRALIVFLTLDRPLLCSLLLYIPLLLLRRTVLTLDLLPMPHNRPLERVLSQEEHRKEAEADHRRDREPDGRDRGGVGMDDLLALRQVRVERSQVADGLDERGRGGVDGYVGELFGSLTK